MSKSERLRNIKQSQSSRKSPTNSTHTHPTKWRTIVALILMYLIVLMNWEWAWGILFLIWVIPDLFSGNTYFIELITKKENPILYWCIVITWLAFSLYSFSTLFTDFDHYLST